MKRALFWFRQDLRLYDNPALYEAALNSDDLILLYIYDKNQLRALGEAQKWWLHHSLQELKNTFHKKNIFLTFLQGDSFTVLKNLVAKENIESLFWNRCYDPHSIERDKKIKTFFKDKNIAVNTYNSFLLQEPWEVKNQSGSYFKVFTPYWRHCLKTLNPRELLPIPKIKQQSHLAGESLESLQLLPRNPNWALGFENLWTPGEKGAANNLENFTDFKLEDYEDGRDIPNKSNTSHLSPHLHFGEISPWQIWHAIKYKENESPKITKACERYLTEIGWREFSYHLLFHFPELATKNFRSEFDSFPWEYSQEHLKAWQKGKTGYPIVDAGMRELWQTGFMHNRIRMVVASFLTKHLLLPWQQGEEWFWNTLLDADNASNPFGWQWTAGSGADAAPYFRIFNPVLQGEKFDPEGLYIKRFVPELSLLPAKYIHAPWEAPKNILQEANITLGKDYPFPIVDHKTAREKALRAYKTLKTIS